MAVGSIKRSRTILPSAARTVLQTSSDINNNDSRGLYMIVDVTAYSAGGLIPAVKGKDPVSGKYFQLHANITTIAATGTFVYQLYPGVGTAAGGITAVNSVVLPKTYQVSVAVSDATSITYSIGVVELP